MTHNFHRRIPYVLPRTYFGGARYGFPVSDSQADGGLLFRTRTVSHEVMSTFLEHFLGTRFNSDDNGYEGRRTYIGGDA